MNISPLGVILATLLAFVDSTRKVPETKLPTLQQQQDQDALSTYVVVIEHSFDQGASPKFTSRGTLSFRSNKPGAGIFVQTAALTAGEKRKLKDLARHDGIYRIRVPTNLEANPADASLEYVSTFTKACALLHSRMSDSITLHIDQSGNVLGVALVPLDASCDGQLQLESSALLDYFNTSVYLSATVPGPSPDTQVFLKKLEEERLQKENGAGPDNRSFLAKYWMYIVPVVLFVLLSGGGDQQRS